MKNLLKVSAGILLCLVCYWWIAISARPVGHTAGDEGYPIQNKAPLAEKPYLELPLGSIRAKGWLREQLVRQKNGATGKLDELYPAVMGPRNGWLGGDGDQWERGPYWIDGLLPLAYQLDDEALKQKAGKWVEAALNSRQDNGYFGPEKDYGFEEGLQRNNSRDWWPKMVMLKVLMQHYSATGDERVIELMRGYFRYQLQHLPETPLDNWTFWAKYRGGDNLMAVYWLYNITGEQWLLDLGKIIYEQNYDFVHAFTQTSMTSEKGTMHCVNLVQGLKTPSVFYQASKDKELLYAVDKGLEDLKRYNGMPHGLFGGDETLHGNNPTQGSELCTAAEMMFSLETMLQIQGKSSFADHIEKIAFNILPTQITDDFMSRQYYQQVNQVRITRHVRNFDVNHGGTPLCYGLLTGYPCCTANMHQAWPKFTQNLWYATPDNGLAALLYAPSEVTATVGNGDVVTVEEVTDYPFKETIAFIIRPEKGPVSFPLHLRVPGWCNSATVKINGKEEDRAKRGSMIVLDRTWESGDRVELVIPMNVTVSRWYENAATVERGPLVYGLKMEEKWKRVDEEIAHGGTSYFEVTSDSPWNYGLRELEQQEFDVEVDGEIASYPWSTGKAPVRIKARASRIPSWKLYNESAGPVPYSIMQGMQYNENIEEITLIPYGCTTLRIAEFPVIGKHTVF
ncbi:beta-L-arabinofuranosidase domain-containing protein [Sinomicrobium soli]|uniref:beta-L-arabinofuranosidase domain-containing protein n=1 Tax=Sinomicrobium sp. N-1-3-6 TaxID=2219864 RepID=UPI000DCEA627|nr:beta-L-arabinofuranosidase domain-containing protein [Sinomicrobium sp. N-1-3-6]RAV28210.1 hypothetical protein DN748_14660 [Sinomicrobium sp. N-1-3-6]